jgi:hypothetical protein
MQNNLTQKQNKKNPTQNGPRIHEKSKQTNTKVETSDSCLLNIGKKYLKTAKIIDESLILAIVLRNYSTKPSYIFQLKRELKVWKYIFNLGSCTISKLIFL